MGMVKLVDPSGWDWAEPVASGVKLASRGLRGHDRTEFLKRASHSFLGMLDGVKFAADEEPVHLIALGASEAYGPNRNGDGFKEATCREHVGTFMKFARFYRNHKNKDPSKSYGLVKAAAYNDRMRRVELLVGLNKTAEAARRNGGLVAESAMEKLARGDDLPVSMACRVPYDVCSWCGNQARTRDEYCGPEKCAAGGCRDCLTMVVKMGGDAHHLHVDNPGAAWFDISEVIRPADRIAWGNRADWLKSAADRAEPRAELTAPTEVALWQDTMLAATPAQAERTKIAHALASLERAGPSAWLPLAFARAFDPAVRGEFPTAGWAEPGTTKLASQLATLADAGIVLPVRAYATVTKRAEHAEAASAFVRGEFARTASSGRGYDLGMLPTGPVHAAVPGNLELLKAAWSLEPAWARRRAELSSLRSPEPPAYKTGFVKAAGDGEGAKLARECASYQVAALHRALHGRCRGADFPLTAGLCLLQNYVG